MQLIAEAYDLLRHGLGMSPAEIATVFTDWNTGRPGVLPHRDHRRGARRTPTPRPAQPFVDVVLDQAEQKGTGRWTVQTALDLGVPVSGIAEAVFARSLSGHAEQRAAAARPARPGRGRRGRPRGLRRRRRAGAVRVQDRRVRAGLRRDHRRRDRVRLGHRPRRDGDDLAGRLHHPGRASSTGSRARTTTTRSCRRCWPTPTSPTRGRTRRRPGGGWSTPARAARHPDARVLLGAGLLRRAAGGTAAGRADPGRSATTSARTPTGGSTGTASSTPAGARTAPKSARTDHRQGSGVHRPLSPVRLHSANGGKSGQGPVSPMSC